MKIQLKSVFLSAALAALILPATAQTDTTAATPVAPKPPVKNAGVAGRKKTQQKRIAQGIKSGELNSKEAARLESKEAKLNKETRAMRAEDGGKLTAADKAKVEHQQNKLSNEIYNQKHDAQTQPTPKTEIGQRKENQQDRIAQGVASGQLTPAETSKLEKREANINKETSEMRQENGGKLTPEEKAKVNRQQNRTSRAIHRQKHDAQHR